MLSEKEFRAYWEGALVWSDDELTEEQKVARCRAYFGLEFQCRHATREGTQNIFCLIDGQYCVPGFLASKMEYCSYFAQMPCNLLQIIKAQSSESQATITQEPKESVCTQATTSPDVIARCDHED